MQAQVLNGSISLFTQTQVNNFNYTEVTGYVLINGGPLFNGGDPITDISPLASLEKVGEFFQIAFVDDTEIILPNLVSVEENGGIFGNTFNITQNPEATILSLPSFTTAYGDIYIQMAKLETIDLPALTAVNATRFTILSNPELTTLNVPNIQTLASWLRIINNDKLTEISSFNNLTNILGSLEIVGNDQLSSITGLSALMTIGGTLRVGQNPQLADCCLFQPLLETPGAVGGTIISANANGCQSISQIFEYCSPCPWETVDIGNPGAGNAYDLGDCETGFTINAGAANNSPGSDNIASITQELCGDFQITTQVASITPNGYAGLMARESGAAGSKMIGVYSNHSSVVRMESRSVTNGPKAMNFFQKPAPYWLKLVRQGNWFYTYYSFNGVNFSFVTAQYLSMNAWKSVWPPSAISRAQQLRLCSAM